MEEITLRGVRPSLFKELASNSQIWGEERSFRRGERYLVHAASGRGKSSLCSFLMGYRHDFEGEILFNDEPHSALSMEAWRELRRTALAYVPQGLMLFEELSARENIHLKNDLTRHRSEEWIEEAIDLSGLTTRADAPTAQLSFGQKQRVAIIRALCQPADFLLLDEPISHLDRETAERMATLIDTACRESGAGIISLSIGQEFDFPYHQTLTL